MKTNNNNNNNNNNNSSSNNNTAGNENHSVPYYNNNNNKKEKKKEKKLTKAISSFLGKQGNTDTKIQEYLKSLEQDNVLFSSVLKELTKTESTFVSKTYVQKDWKEVEVEMTSVPTDIMALIDINKALAEGFKFEFGRNNITYKSKVEIEDPEKDILYYKEYFYEQEHAHYLAEGGEEDKTMGGVVISVELPSNSDGDKKCIIRTKKGTERITIPSVNSNSEKEILKYLKQLKPEFSKLKFVRSVDQELSTRLLTMESKSIMLLTRYKFGVLYVTDGQTDENEMFSNSMFYLLESFA